MITFAYAAGTIELDKPAPGPVQPGAPTKCPQWVEPTPGSTCLELTDGLGITVDEFKKMNPQLEGNCQKNLWTGYNYCISVSINILSILMFTSSDSWFTGNDNIQDPLPTFVIH